MPIVMGGTTIENVNFVQNGTPTVIDSVMMDGVEVFTRLKAVVFESDFSGVTYEIQ